MNAHIARAMQSTSEIAIETATSQKVSAVILPFRAPDRQSEPESMVASIEPVVTEPAIIAENDNAPAVAVPALPAFGASALIERPAITRGMEIITHAIDKRNRYPILSNVMLRGTGEALHLTATDLDMEIAVKIPAAADGEFATTLPAHLMRDLLKKAAASEYVSITTADGFAKLDFERVDFRLQSLPIEDFPALSLGAVSSAFEMSGASFWALLDGTMDAISTEESRDYLNGIFFHTLNNGNRRTIVAVATDGHRLYRQEFELPFGADDMPGVIIPRKMVDVLHRLMKGKACPATVAIEVNASKIRVSYDDVVITSKVIDGTFPDYQRVVPMNNSKAATINAKALIEGVESVSLISSERGRAVKFEMSDGNCRLIVNNPDAGSATMDVACDYSSDPMEVGFNAKYLISAIKDASLSCEEITIHLEDAGSPMLMTSNRDGWTAVVMPMRV